MEIFKEYYENGVLKAKGGKINGLKEGKWIYNYESGKLFREINFTRNEENGEWKMWYENGNLYIDQYKIFGKPDGLWKEFYENGRIKEVGEYKNGQYYPINFWDKFDNQILKNGTGKKIETFGHSELDISEFYYKDGVFLKEVKISFANYLKFLPK